MFSLFLVGGDVGFFYICGVYEILSLSLQKEEYDRRGGGWRAGGSHRQRRPGLHHGAQQASHTRSRAPPANQPAQQKGVFI